ncbi:hypothetical protein EPD83_020025 [Phycicoccus sp. CMS6Z-2]|uniref:Uncharacterized protein n=1 Tax=Phycicoccus flavus TaxID=2502783 RepID=A0A8T6RBW5_9MICO|nr:hypothetical protein [Phycicoccus flavus]
MVLVASSGGSSSAPAAAVQRLLGGAPRCLVTASGDDAVETAAEVGDALGVDAVVDRGWSDPASGPGAWDRVVERGGTTVVVCPPDVVRAVLGHLLGVPADRQSRLAAPAGSLAGVEVWPGDDVSIAFTGRT